MASCSLEVQVLSIILTGALRSYQLAHSSAICMMRLHLSSLGVALSDHGWVRRHLLARIYHLLLLRTGCLEVVRLSVWVVIAACPNAERCRLLLL